MGTRSLETVIEQGDLAIGTRFFGKDPQKDLPRLDSFIDAAVGLGKVYVAINAADDKTYALAHLQARYPPMPPNISSRNDMIVAFAVSPWGKFVPPLNAIVYQAALAGADYVLLASAEFPPAKAQAELLMQYMDEQTLVVGARFSEHSFRPSETVEGTGTTVPWNTFALWNLGYLARTGFALAGDAPFNQSKAGVEELTTIAVLQSLYDTKAYLVEVPGVGGQWNTAGWDAVRLEQHQKKIASKNERPAAQLAWAHLRAPTINHVSSSAPSGSL